MCRFEDLRIRRETKQKNYNKESGRKADKTKNTRNDKTACLRFTATLQLAPDREIELTVMSKPIQLCKYACTYCTYCNQIHINQAFVHCNHHCCYCCLGAPPEGAELEWLIPEYGHANGDEKIVIKGTKMTCRKYNTLTTTHTYVE